MTAVTGLNPFLPIAGAVYYELGDERVLALSLELAKVSLGLREGDHREEERLLGFVLAALCKGKISPYPDFVPQALFWSQNLALLIAKMLEVRGPIGELAQEILDEGRADEVALGKLCTRARLPFEPFQADEKLRELSRGNGWTFSTEDEWLQIRAGIETVAPSMMPVFGWAAGKRLAELEHARAVTFWMERYDRVRAFLIGVAGGPFAKQYDLGAGRVSWVRSADRSVVARGKALVLGTHDTRNNVFVAAWADAGLGKVRRASRANGVPDSESCGDVESYWLASKICAAEGYDFLDVIEDDDVVTYVGLKDVHQPGWRVLLGGAIKFLLRQRATPSWAEMALPGRE